MRASRGDRSSSTGERLRSTARITATLATFAALAVALSVAFAARADTDETQEQLASTERDLADARQEIEAISEELDALRSEVDETGVDGITGSVRSLQEDQAATARRLAILSTRLDDISEVASELSAFLGNDLRLSRVDRYVLEGCVQWTVEQIRQMAGGYAPDRIPPNDCRLLG